MVVYCQITEVITTMQIQRQPVHDFTLSVVREREQPDQYKVRIITPQNYNRAHLGNIDLIKAAEEAVVLINQGDGLEKLPGYKKKLLVRVQLQMTEEIIKFDDLIIELNRNKQKRIRDKIWQEWTFELCKNIGHLTTCYIY